jgi:PTH1 family peptidyl-tRNA hydrolase
MAFRMIAGLGNPGPEYEKTRHNAGFLALDIVAQGLGARYWKNECGALTAHVKNNGQDLILVKPQAFMNTSGGPLSKLADLYGVKPEEIVVIHDDMDLDPGTIRVKVGGGHGGHNGLKSIHAKLQDDGYVRVRVGTGHPPGRKPVVDYVLQTPKGDDAEAFEHAVALAADAVSCIIDHGAAKAMNIYN